MKLANISKFKLQINELMLICVILFELIYFLVDAVFYVVGENVYNIFRMLNLMIIFASCFKQLHIDKKSIIIIPVITVIAIFAVMYNGSPVGVITQIVWPLTIIAIFGNYTPNGDFYIILKKISKIFIYLLVLKAVVFYRNIDYNSFLNNDSKQVNPNSTALLLVYLFWFATLKVDKKNSLSTIKNYFLFITVCVGIICCGSRASLISLLVTVFIKMFFSKLINNNNNKIRVIAVGFILCVLAVGIAFPYFYTAIFKSGVAANVTIMGKQVFTGREWIWMNLFNYMDNNSATYLFGTGYNDSFYKDGSFNLHNAYLMILAQYGIIVLGLYLFYYVSIIWSMLRYKSISDIKLRMYLVVLTNFIVGIGETTLSYIPMLIFPALALSICNNRKADNTYGYPKNNPFLLVWK